MRRIKQFISEKIFLPIIGANQALGGVSDPGIPRDIKPRTDFDINALLLLIQKLLGYLLTLVSIVAVVMLIYAGYLFMTGNDENITKAKTILKYAIVGIIVVFLSYSAVGFINSLLG